MLNIPAQEEFPSIAGDFQLPAGLVPADQLFSSVLRLSSPATTVWTHYDIMDNLYCQVLLLVVVSLSSPAGDRVQARGVVAAGPGEPALPGRGQVSCPRHRHPGPRPGDAPAFLVNEFPLLSVSSVPPGVAA